LAAALLREVEMLMLLQRFDERGEKGDELFGINPVGCVLYLEQRMLDFWSVLSRAWALRRVLHLFCMVEEPYRVLAIVSSGCGKCIK
jgi:hypothetical protein